MVLERVPISLFLDNTEVDNWKSVALILFLHFYSKCFQGKAEMLLAFMSPSVPWNMNAYGWDMISSFPSYFQNTLFPMSAGSHTLGEKIFLYILSVSAGKQCRKETEKMRPSQVASDQDLSSGSLSQEQFCRYFPKFLQPALESEMIELYLKVS